MKVKIFDGRKFAEEKEKELAKKVLDLKSHGIYPHLASIIVGNNPASEMYVGMKKKRAEAIGIQVSVYRVSLRDKEEDLIKLIEFLNNDPDFTGIMIQMPLPEKFQMLKKQIISKAWPISLVNLIRPEKDVDGLREDSKFLHPTSKAVLEIIKFAEGVGTACVVGATGMVGKPLVQELKKLNYKVIECNSKTEDLKGRTLQADILVSATGVPNLIKADMVKKGAIVIDVGSPVGDIDFDSVSKVAGFITPVPRGVGPVTISCLLENLLI